MPRKWKQGEPKGLGYYVVEFAEGDKFGVVQRHFDDDKIVIENLNDGGYISDPIIANLMIPKPTENPHPMFCFQHGGSEACEETNEREGFSCPKCQEEAKYEDALPKYVAIGHENGSALIRHGGGEYHRPAGQWSLISELTDEGELVVSDQQSHLSHIHGEKLIPISAERFEEDNGGYF